MNRIYSPTVEVEIITQAVCEVYSITKTALLRKTRKQEVVRPRQVLRYLICKHGSGLSLKQIAAMTGECDHSTVIYSRDFIQEQVAINAYGRPFDAEIAEQVARCEALLNQNYFGTYAPRCYPMAGVI